MKKTTFLFISILVLSLAGCLEWPTVEEDNDDDQDTAYADIYYVQVVDGMEEIVPFEREIEMINGIEESALSALVEGVPGGGDFSSSIPEGTELLSFTLEDGVATADFSGEIDPGGGSAWVTSIREQIEQTLMQFDTVNEVEILVEGEEDSLQP